LYIIFKNKIVLIGILCLSVCVSACSKTVQEETELSKQPVVVTAGVDHTEINIGDKITYTITIAYDQDLDIQLPEFGQNLAGFAIKDFGQTKQKKKGKYLIREQWYLLDTYVSGSYTIPAPVVIYTASDGIEEQVEGKELTVEVRSLLSEESAENDIRDIKPPVNLPVSYAKFIWAGVIGLLVIAAAIAVLVFFLNREKYESRISRSRPAHEIAYEQLEMIRQEDLIAKGMIEEYYVRLSDTIRHYLENRFALRAPEMTSEEFLQVASDYSGFNESRRSLLNDFLGHCDLVKFAQYGPNEREIEAVFYSAKQLVDETKELGTEPDANNVIVPDEIDNGNADGEVLI